MTDDVHMDDNNKNKHNNHKKELKHTGQIILLAYQTKKNVHWKQKKNNNIDRIQKEDGKLYMCCLFNTFIFTSMHITLLTH